MSKDPGSWDRRLNEAFSGQDFYEAHARAGVILAEMGADVSVLHDIAEKNIQASDFFERARINPVLALEISKNHRYSLIGHCWLPLDDGRLDLTHQSVHHHGKLLLTSMSAWGQGYESVLFKKGFKVLNEQGHTQMEIDKIYKNPQGHLEFIGTDTPHVVFFPASFTVTYALWSREVPQPWGRVKQLPWLQAYKKRIKSGLELFGLSSGLGLQAIRDLDFCPREGRLVRMRERVTYQPGSRDGFLDNFFWCLQQMKFDRFGVIGDRIRAAGGHQRAEDLLARLEKGEPLHRRMELVHLGVDKVQFSRQELLDCFASQPGRRTACLG